MEGIVLAKIRALDYVSISLLLEHIFNFQFRIFYCTNCNARGFLTKNSMIPFRLINPTLDNWYGLLYLHVTCGR